MVTAKFVGGLVDRLYRESYDAAQRYRILKDAQGRVFQAQDDLLRAKQGLKEAQHALLLAVEEQAAYEAGKAVK